VARQSLARIRRELAGPNRLKQRRVGEPRQHQEVGSDTVIDMGGGNPNGWIFGS